MMHDPIDPLAIPPDDASSASDERLGALLRAAVREEPPAWDALQARLASRGADALARRRLASRRDDVEWWELAARWSRAALPLAIAASAELILSLARQREATAAVPSVRSVIEEVVASADGETDLLRALIGTTEQTSTDSGAYDRE